MNQVNQVNQSSPYKSSYRSEIDGLRAFAVLSVVAFHAFPSLLKGGFIGVDVFFVISGFLITSHIFEKLDKGQFSFTDFFGRRIRRIFPALILVMACSLAFGWFALLADEFAQLGKHVVSGAAFITNFILVVDESGYFDNAAETKPMLHLWSLAVEEQFYIVWPLVLWLAWKRKFNLLTITILVAVVSFYLNLRFVKSHPTETFFWPVGRFWELLSGSILAWLLLYKSDLLSRFKLWIDRFLVRIIHFKEVEADGSTASNLMSFFGLLLLAYGVIRINESLSFPSKWALIPVLGAVLIIASGSKAWLNRIFLMNPIAVWFGLISYPLYLWHWPILSFLHIVAGEMPHRDARIFAVLLSLLSAWLTYKFIEGPVRNGKFNNKKSMGLLIVLCSMGLVGLAITFKDGVPNRVVNPFDESKVGHNSKCRGQDKADVCVLGNELSNKKILVYGDSHALHLTTELERQFGSDYKIVVITDGSCFMGTELKRWHREQNRAERCKEKIELLEREVEAKEFDITITSQRWYGYGFRTVDDYHKVIRDRVKNFGISTKHLVIIGSTSDVNYGCEKNIFRPISLSNACELSKNSELTINYVDNFMKASQSFADKAIFIYPHQLLCGGERCSALWEGDVLYADTHHLSEIGSRIVVNQIASKVTR